MIQRYLSLPNLTAAKRYTTQLKCSINHNLFAFKFIDIRDFDGKIFERGSRARFNYKSFCLKSALSLKEIQTLKILIQ
jgi:hypothetical protein